jgi:hypothetical protein
MYKINIFTILWLSIATCLQAQTDTIYTINKAIAGTVIELGISEVRYLKPGNNTMSIVVQRCAIHKIKFANGEEMILDSALVLQPFVNDSSLQPVILTHLDAETEGLILVCEKEIMVPSNYYYNTYSRPKQSEYVSIVQEANVVGAELVYLPEKVNILNEADIYAAKIYSIKAKFYTLALRDYSMITSMVSLDKEYSCIVETLIANGRRNIMVDTIVSAITITNIASKNNMCVLVAKLHDEFGDEDIEMTVTYFDGDKFTAEYISSMHKIKNKITFYFIQPSIQIGPIEKGFRGIHDVYNFNTD